MTKVDALRRFLPCCLFPSAAATTNATYTFKTRISTSLRDDLDLTTTAKETQESKNRDSQDSTASIYEFLAIAAPPRPSKTMVIGTVFGCRKGHIWFCVQQDRLSTKPSLLLELPIATHHLVREMHSGIVRLFLECDSSELRACPLRSIPAWMMFCNGKKIGYAFKRKASEQIQLMLKRIMSITVGVGVIPAGSASSGLDQEGIIYMRATYEHVVGSADAESFHLVNAEDECSGQGFVVFLMRSC